MDKERFEACVKLAEFGAGRWDARRGFEWRLSLGLWALLAVAIHSFRVESIPVVLPWVACGIYIFWINNIWWSNYLDRLMMRTYREYCTKMLNEKELIYIDKYKPKLAGWFAKRPKLNRFFGFLADWAAIFQLSVTFMLIYLAYRYCQKIPALVPY